MSFGFRVSGFGFTILDLIGELLGQALFRVLLLGEVERLQRVRAQQERHLRKPSQVKLRSQNERVQGYLAQKKQPPP